MRRALVFAIAIAVPSVAAAQAPGELPADPPPPEALPPRPPLPPPPLPQETAPMPSMLRQGIHLGVSFGLEVARDLGPAYAVGAGAQVGWELYWPSIALELAVEAQAHGDMSGDQEHGFWEAHSALFVKFPFKKGVWEFFAGYGFSLDRLHGGWLPSDQDVHVGAVGLEDRTSRAYSRLFLRAYVPQDGGLSGVTVIVCATVGLFRLL